VKIGGKQQSPFDSSGRQTGDLLKLIHLNVMNLAKEIAKSIDVGSSGKNCLFCGKISEISIGETPKYWLLKLHSKRAKFHGTLMCSLMAVLSNVYR